MKTRYVIWIVAALAVFAAIFAVRFAKDRRALAARAGMVQPPTTVSTALVQQVTWPNTARAVGTITSHRGITVQNELEGVVQRIAFKSGMTVPAGALLVELDTSVETATLGGLEAQAKLAEINVTRARDLRTSNTNTQSELDSAEAVLAQTRAAVDQLRATIAKKRIVAPFAGRLGISRIYPGQLLAKSEAIVELESLESVYVDFSLPQQEYGRVAAGGVVHLRVDAHAGRIFQGVIEAVAPRVNSATRTLNARALVPNPDEALAPGMFGNVEVVLPGTENVTVLPTAAIVYNPYGNFVYVVEQGAAVQRFVQTGAQRGNLIAVTSGVKTGEQVVTTGQIKLRNGAPVRVDNSVVPSANPTPAPKEG
ncbi:efflux RND transporter periplasmic adaptor subunit [Opitutus sp. ER46]|uniref:efflux RND transporter periplasmic adaptor subunit n=1 Tax=Opitutus sp. ER46 TaxID=2161864 RepID=UPI000D311417|nr:efflux RND transporter periplasmic adaptor subunit [Opitutus sp. ER46]PTX96447.1 efflux transporter periplasmic adaptor subunit [Opitutus sp. ER46]